MSGRAVSIDGVVVGPGAAQISVYDRGFLYGDAVFEVLRTYRGVPFALDEHLARLRRSAERVFIVLPVDDATLRGDVERTVAAAGNDESYVRVVVTRGSGPLSLDPATAGTPLRVVLVELVVPPPREHYAHGIGAILLRSRRATDDTEAAGAKVGNYLANLLALREAKARGAQEALIVDGEGRVVEGASSNVFVVRAGHLVTPPASAGILVGITRGYILAAARALGLPVEERTLSPADVTGADEVFITSSIREVLPVVRVDDAPVGAGVPGAVTRSLHRRFREHAGMYERPMPWD